jgi:AbiTii
MRREMGNSTPYSAPRRRKTSARQSWETPMASIIEQIQRDAVNDQVPVSTLLRKVKLAAAKLRLGTVEDWVESELNGYKSPVPDYRMARGRPMSQNPVRGWEPIGGHIEQLSTRAVGESVAAIEQLTRSAAAANSTLHLSYSDSIMQKLNKSN